MSNEADKIPIEILLIEDHPGDVCLTLEALKEVKIYNNFSIVNDGIEAMAFLRKQGKYTAAPRPDLILLDLNLPLKDGRQVLIEIKEEPSLTLIPVIVLTTSQSEIDVLQTYSHHANCYIVKPIDLDRFLSVVKSLTNFWLSIVKLPPKLDEESINKISIGVTQK